MSSATKTRTGNEVIAAMLAADTPAARSKATRLQNEYVAQRAAEGKDPKKVLGGIRARYNRLRDEAGKKTTSKTKAKTKSTVKVTAKAK
ncbi:MAG: hypothetical protein NVSMB9_27290 [Isosphaeraceae bacterium]